MQILVTHHVELVLPGAYYLVRMLDGRIDTQGTIKELQAQGVLERVAVQNYHEDVKSVDTPEDSVDRHAVTPKKFVEVWLVFSILVSNSELFPNI